MLLFGDVAVRAVDLLAPQDFFRRAHQQIFESILRLVERGVAVDYVTVRHDLDQRGVIDSVGGAVYLMDMTNGQVRSLNVDHYAEIVKEMRRRRELVYLAIKIDQQARDGSHDSRALLEMADKELGHLSGQSQVSEIPPQAEAMGQFLDALDHRISHKHELLGLSTGWQSLDDLTCGLIPGEVTIVAAATGAGKTAFALNVAAHTASQHHSVMMVSLEMSRQQLLFRIASLRSGVEMFKIRKGYLTNLDVETVCVVMADTAGWPLFIEDMSTLTVRDIRARCRRQAMAAPLKLIVIDYIQLVSTAGKSDNRATEVGEVGRGIKLLARELNVPIIALSQLSRASTKEKNTRPQLHHLRESGALEQHADNVWFLHEGKDDEIELIIGKQRQGPLGSVTMKFDKPVCRFTDVAEEKKAWAKPVQAYVPLEPA